MPGRRQRPGSPHERGRLTTAARASDGRSTYFTAAFARADGVLAATPTERQGSRMIGALGDRDGFAVALEEVGGLPPGAAVEILGLGSGAGRSVPLTARA